MSIFITNKDVLFAPVYFAATAVDRKSLKEQLHYMRAKDGVLVGASSNQLHEIDNVDLEDGFYKPVKLTKHEIILEYKEKVDGYPNIEQVKPSDKSYKDVYVPEPDPEVFAAKVMSTICIGLPYSQLASISKYVNTVSYKNGKSPLLLSEFPVVFAGTYSRHGTYALIMPYNFK